MKFRTLTVILLLLSMAGCSHKIGQLQQAPLRHYVVVDVIVADHEQYDRFLALEKPILKQFDAFITMDIRNEDQHQRYIIVSFPNRDSVDAFVSSAEFQEILPLSKRSARSKIFHGKDFEGFITN